MCASVLHSKNTGYISNYHSHSSYIQQIQLTEILVPSCMFIETFNNRFPNNHETWRSATKCTVKQTKPLFMMFAASTGSGLHCLLFLYLTVSEDSKNAPLKSHYKNITTICAVSIAKIRKGKSRFSTF